MEDMLLASLGMEDMLASLDMEEILFSLDMEDILFSLDMEDILNAGEGEAVDGGESLWPFPPPITLRSKLGLSSLCPRAPLSRASREEHRDTVLLDGLCLKYDSILVNLVCYLILETRDIYTLSKKAELFTNFSSFYNKLKRLHNYRGKQIFEDENHFNK